MEAGNRHFWTLRVTVLALLPFTPLGRQALWAEDLGDHRGQAWKDWVVAGSAGCSGQAAYVAMLRKFAEIGFCITLWPSAKFCVSSPGVAIGWHYPAAACRNSPR